MSQNVIPVVTLFDFEGRIDLRREKKSEDRRSGDGICLLGAASFDRPKVERSGDSSRQLEFELPLRCEVFLSFCQRPVLGSKGESVNIVDMVDGRQRGEVEQCLRQDTRFTSSHFARLRKQSLSSAPSRKLSG